MLFAVEDLNQQEAVTLTPQFALVFHGKDSHNADTITLHGVDKGVIQLGQYVDTQDAINMMVDSSQSTATRYETNLIPQHVLVDDNEQLVWFRKAQRRTLHLREKRGQLHQNVTFPALLFIARKGTRSLKIFALGSNARPTLTTKLYNAPFCNLDSAGSLCIGTATFPNEVAIQTITDMENAFFDANGTHTNHDRTLSTKAKKQYGSLFKYWKHKAKAQEQVRVAELTFFKTLQEVIND